MNARLAPEPGQLIESVIAAVARSEGLTHAEALVRMAEIALVAVHDTKRPSRPLRGDERPAIVVYVNASDIPGTVECSPEHPTGHIEGSSPQTAPTCPPGRIFAVDCLASSRAPERAGKTRRRPAQGRLRGASP